MILSGTNSEYFIRTLARNLQSLNRKSTPRQPLRIQAVLWIIGTAHSVDDLFATTMSSFPKPLSRVLPQASSRAGSARGRRWPVSALTPSSRPRPAKECHPKNHQLDFRPYSPVWICRTNHRSYASHRHQPSGGTYRMNMGNNKEEEKSALEQYGVDLTSKARDGKLDPVIGRDSVGRSSSPGICL